jgi:hypothetical protein
MPRLFDGRMLDLGLLDRRLFDAGDFGPTARGADPCGLAPRGGVRLRWSCTLPQGEYGGKQCDACRHRQGTIAQTRAPPPSDCPQVVAKARDLL